LTARISPITFWWTMRISPSFESQASFEDVGMSTRENEDVLQMDWGVVSTTESDAVSGWPSSGTSREYIGQGILIVDGIDSAASRNEPSSNLSLPGSDSIPSDLGSLSEDPSVDKHNMWLVNKRMIYIIGSLVLLAFSAVTGLLIRQHVRYQSVMQELGEKIQQLEKEKEELPQPVWLGEGELNESSSFFTLLDTCWVKAKMNLKFGDCSQNSFGLCGEFVSHATESLKAWFSENIPKLEGERMFDEAGDDTAHGHEDILTALATYPDIIGEAMVSASKAVSEMIMKLNLAAVEGAESASDDLVSASEAFADAATSAKGAVAYNFNEFVKDPIRYFTGAVEEAVQPPPPTKVTMNGLYNTAKTFSDASAELANAVAETSESFSNMMTHIFTKPLSFLESKDKEL